MTEMTLNEACAETQKFARMLKGMERLGDVANALASADQAVADRRRQEAEVLARIAAAQGQLEEIDSRVTAAREAAAAAATSAEQKASEIISAAREQAEKSLAAAREEEERARAAAGEVIARANAAERRLKTAQDELAAVEARLEQAKAEGRKIFGGS